MHKGLQWNEVCIQKVTKKVKGHGNMWYGEKLKEIGKFRDVVGIILCGSQGHTLDQQVVNSSSIDRTEYRKWIFSSILEENNIQNNLRIEGTALECGRSSTLCVAVATTFNTNAQGSHGGIFSLGKGWRQMTSNKPSKSRSILHKADDH